MQTLTRETKTVETQESDQIIAEAMTVVTDFVAKNGLEDRYKEYGMKSPYGFLIQDKPVTGYLRSLTRNPYDYRHARTIELWTVKVSRNDGAADSDFVDPSAFSEVQLVFVHPQVAIEGGGIEKLASYVVKRNGWDTDTSAREAAADFVNNTMMRR